MCTPVVHAVVFVVDHEKSDDNLFVWEFVEEHEETTTTWRSKSTHPKHPTGRRVSTRVTDASFLEDGGQRQGEAYAYSYPHDVSTTLSTEMEKKRKKTWKTRRRESRTEKQTVDEEARWKWDVENITERQ